MEVGQVQQQQEPKEEPEEEECNVAWSISAVDEDLQKFTHSPVKTNGMMAVGQPTAVTQVKNRWSAMEANGKIAIGQPIAVTQAKPMKVHIFNRFKALQEQDTIEDTVGQPAMATMSKARKLEPSMPVHTNVHRHGSARMPMSRKKRVLTKFNACKCCPMMNPNKEQENEEDEEMIGRVMEGRSSSEEDEAELVGEVK